ncbi:glycosyltransferase family 2 protein [uncultured Arcanobacterium sp.]|uniref:glycosyltransferase family 2 protein n=1 Tax=uncultured Arcanobacterium sp. TaxID=487520 RepID=UPI00262D0FDA|nr:glycosyltransferase family 2 protein [uncultured Arcanobacterium sp.]
MNNLLVIIPAWNEAGAIASVIQKTHSTLPKADILVVNDSSSDNTAEIARQNNAVVLDLPINLGVGGAMRAGFVYAVQNSYEYVVQVDADGQHDPQDIPRLLEKAKQGADIVIGARFAGRGSYSAKGPRKWAMSILAFVMSKYGKIQLTDVTSGFKMYSRRAFTFFSTNYPAEYLGDTIEALMMGLRLGMKVEQVPVAMHARAVGTPSQSPIRAAIYLFRAILSLAVGIISPIPVELKRNIDHGAV